MEPHPGQGLSPMSGAGRATVGDERQLGLLSGVSFQPIFIMGDHRTGTTLLYQLLDATQCFNVVRAYHIVRYEAVLSNYLDGREESARQRLGEVFKEMGVTDRMLDGVKATPDLPEEYGFLLGQGLRPRLSPKSLPRFVEACRKVQFVSDPQKPLLLKNPWDFTNFLYLHQVFPNAKFIFLHRNPIVVINSQIKAARVLYAAKSPYHALLDSAYNQVWEQPLRLGLIRLLFSSHFDLGFRTASRHVARATRHFLEHVHRLAQRDYLGVKFEDLCQEPQLIITEILNFLEMGDNTVMKYDGFVQPRPTRLLEVVRRKKTSVMKRLRPYFIYCQYQTEGAGS